MRFKFVLKENPSSTSPNAKISTVAEYSFNGGMFTIGSDSHNTIVLSDGAPEQAVVVQEGESLTLINSAEGTSLNGRTLRREAIEPLAGNDVIEIGNHAISVVPLIGEKRNGGNGSDNSVTTDSHEPTAIVNKNEEKSPDASDELFDPSAKRPPRNFADILNTLRTEEDSFYFIVENPGQAQKRIPLEQSEMPLGFDAGGNLSCTPDGISVLLATIKKDWSGIVIEPHRRGVVVVNEEKLSTARRLRNEDRVSLHFQRMGTKYSSSLILHEPNSLVALESLMEIRPGGDVPGGNTHGGPAAGERIPLLERHFFGYFSFFEVFTMTVVTLIAALLVFLLLELTGG